MTILTDLFGYLLFPGLLGLTLSTLYFGPYRMIKDVNQPFEEYKRPLSLQRLMQILIICVLGLFITVQFFRIPFFMSVFTSLVDSSLIGQSLGVALKTGVVAIVALAELIVLSHLCTYLILSWIGTRRFQSPQPVALPAVPPKVAVLIPSCDENPSVLERSISTVSHLQYPNLRVLLIENSRSAEYKKQAHKVAEKYSVEVIDIPNRGHKAGALNDAEALLRGDFKYSAVFDADQLISGDLVSDAVSLLEADEKLGLIQTPQAHQNSHSSLLACAISQQQMLLYDGILEGKGALRRAPCYGTNFVVRRQALKEAGGWDETNLTEDLTTSYHIHTKGWDSLYLRRLYAVGLTPPNLDAYWKQQLRWAEGNTTLLFQLLRALLGGKLRSVPFFIVVEYLLAASFYLNTFAISVLALCPTLLLTYDLFSRDLSLIDPLASSSTMSYFQWMYLSLYPLYLIVVFFPYLNMGLRGYPLRNMMLVQGLVSITSPVYLKGVKRALFSRRPAQFETSIKIADRSTPRKSLLWTPQTAALLIFVIAGSFVLHTGLTTSTSAIPWILLFWIFIHSLSLSHFFIFRLESQRHSSPLHRQ